MGTVIRAEVSKKNPYRISKHRYYELVHFCLQYPEWEKEYKELSFYPSGNHDIHKTGNLSDPTWNMAEKRVSLEFKMRLVKDTAIRTRSDIWSYIFRSVTEGKSFGYFEALGIPCGRDLFYENRRKFFYLLDLEKGD